MSNSLTDLSLLLKSTLAMGLLLANGVRAQTLTTLHNFSDGDGSAPSAEPLVLSNKLYGTTSSGGTSDSGTVFFVGEDGAGFKTIHCFAALDPTTNTNLDGASPQCRLLVSSSLLYGTTRRGGKWGNGTVFNLNLDGRAFAVLHHFTGGKSEGAYPAGGLVLSGATLYGTTSSGGPYSGGTVFAINVDGTGFTNLYNFAPISAFGGDPRGGYLPSGPLLLFENSLYGTTTYGGVDPDGNLTQNGTVFGLIDRTSFTVLYTFTATSGPPYYTNSDGVNPNGGLVASGNTLYGTTYQGGVGNSGTIFSLDTGGTGFKLLHSFSPISNGTNRDGAYPLSGVARSGNALYGTTYSGGTFGGFDGTAFYVSIYGTAFQTLRNFAGFPADGGAVYAGLTLAGGNLYGTTFNGGELGGGTVFKISFPPQLTSRSSAGKVVVTWPATVAGFDYSEFRLQSTRHLISGPWTTDLPDPELMDEQYTVTIPMTGNQQFFRLSQ